MREVVVARDELGWCRKQGKDIEDLHRVVWGMKTTMATAQCWGGSAEGFVAICGPPLALKPWLHLDRIHIHILLQSLWPNRLAL